MLVDEFAQTEDPTEPENDSKTKKARRAGQALAQLIGYFNRDVKRNRELASFASAQEYASSYPKFGYRVEALDLDKDKDTPDNTVNKKTGQRIFKSRDTMQGYFGTGDYATRRANRGKDKKIAVDNSLLTPYQRYQGLVKGKISADNHWIPSDKMPSEFNQFKKLVGQNMESIRPRSILAQATRQLDPQGTRIQEYRTENPTTQAQLTDVDISIRIFNSKKRGKKLDAVAFQIIQSQLNNIRQILIDNGFQ
ncbi:MAG: hypothetical protein EZS28_047767 [Streblomastix strix]|uniref:Uncharacterized protein n=1 Tax=Streblomastix strix TaxID=222440 RepID=A0A5J4TE31_9EUKA|nr:MAG: hypothetical protein EZS28_047767 [Streblomastix strix]